MLPGDIVVDTVAQDVRHHDPHGTSLWCSAWLWDIQNVFIRLLIHWTSGPRCINPTDDKSTLVQVMAWCRQATSHYLCQWWPRSVSPYGFRRLQWVKAPWLFVAVLWSILVTIYWPIISRKNLNDVCNVVTNATWWIETKVKKHIHLATSVCTLLFFSLYLHICHMCAPCRVQMKHQLFWWRVSPCSLTGILVYTCRIHGNTSMNVVGLRSDGRSNYVLIKISALCLIIWWLPSNL